MRRPLVFFALLWICGMVLAGCPVFSTGQVITVMCCLCVLLLAFSRWRPRQLQLWLLMLVLGLALTGGFLRSRMASFRDEAFRRQVWMTSDRQPVTVTGQVIRPVRARANSDELVLDRVRVHRAGQTIALRSKLLLLVKDVGKGQPAIGEMVEGHGFLRTIRGPAGPGQFNYRQWLAAQGIYAQLWCLAGSYRASGRIPDDWSTFILRLVGQWRQLFRYTFQRYFSDANAGLARSLVLGERAQLSPGLEDALVRSGVMHITAVSGLHVTLLAGAACLALKLLYWVGFARARRRVLLLPTLILVAALAGFKTPALRAVIMGLATQLGLFLERESDRINNIAGAALLILIVWPAQLFEMSFLLSFFAVSAIIILAPVFNPFFSRLLTRWLPDIGPGIARGLTVSIAASIGVLPLFALQFYQISFVGCLANLVVVPLLAATMPLLLILVVMGQWMAWAAPAFAEVCSILLTGMRWVTVFCADAFPGWFQLPAPPVYLICALYLSVLLVTVGQTSRTLSRRRLIRRRVQAAVSVWLVALLLGWMTPWRGLTVEFLDIGQGDATFFRFPNGRTLLVDTGPWDNDDPDEDGPVTRFLRARGISYLDVVVATHADRDHIGQLPEVLEEFRVGALVWGAPVRLKSITEQVYHQIHRQNIRLIKADRGQALTGFEPARVLILHPQRGRLSGVPESDRNDESVVLLVTWRELSVLMTGDIDRQRETELITAFPGLRATVLKVAHHGSRHSTSAPWLMGVQPEVAVISVGPNAYGHPHPDVLSRLQGMGCTVMRTDWHGTVRLTSDGYQYWLSGWRSWYDYYGSNN